MKTIGNKIKKLRIDRKMTQQELANKIGVVFTTVSLYESDTRKPSFKALERISKAFNVSPAFFFEGRENDSEIKDEQIRIAANNMKNLSKDDIKSINAIINSLMRASKNGE